MRRRSRVAGLLALLACAALALARGCSEESDRPADDTPERSRANPAPVDVRSATQSPQPPGAAPMRAPTRRPRPILSGSEPATPPGRPPVVIDVTVLRADGRPDHGALVRVFQSGPIGGDASSGAARELPPERGRTFTRRDGRAHLEIDGAVWGCFVAASHGDEAAVEQKATYLK